MSETAPVKRGRGRPRKNLLPFPMPERNFKEEFLEDKKGDSFGSGDLYKDFRIHGTSHLKKSFLVNEEFGINIPVELIITVKRLTDK